MAWACPACPSDCASSPPLPPSVSKHCLPSHAFLHVFTSFPPDWFYHSCTLFSPPSQPSSLALIPHLPPTHSLGSGRCHTPCPPHPPHTPTTFLCTHTHTRFGFSMHLFSHLLWHPYLFFFLFRQDPACIHTSHHTYTTHYHTRAAPLCTAPPS